MATVTVTLSGLVELEEKLREESKQVAKRTVVRAARDAADIWVDAIETSAPYKTGDLAHNIVMSTTTVEDGIQLMVGPAKKVFYAIFAEFGTRHETARPFIRPAYEDNKQAVLDQFVSDLNDELEVLKE